MLTKEGAGGGIYDYTVYEDGWLPNGINICTGDTIPPAEHTDAEKFNYYPRRFMDIAAYGSQILNTGITTTYVNTLPGCWRLLGRDRRPCGGESSSKVYPMFVEWHLTNFKCPHSLTCGGVLLEATIYDDGFKCNIVCRSGDPTIIIEGSTTQNVKTEDGNFTGNWPLRD